MRLTLNYCSIADVELVDPKPSDNQRKGRRVKIDIDEEDFFDMLDHVNPKNIVKYLDMRRINHRDALEINVTDCTVKLSGRASKAAEGVRRGLYNMNQRNRKKLNRALEVLDSMRSNEKL